VILQLTKNDADFSQLHQNEEQSWKQAKGLVDAGRYRQAQQSLENILSGGVHRTDAQPYFDKVIQLQPRDIWQKVNFNPRAAR